MTMLRPRLRVALAQMDIVPGDWEANVMRAFRFLEDAGNLRCDFVLLPEMWCTGFPALETLAKIARSTFSKTLDLIQQWAQRFHLWLLAGSIPEVAGQDLYNSAYLAGPDGELQGYYRKMHLFPAFDEPAIFQPGRENQPLLTPWGKIGVQICFDLRFPLGFCELRNEGVRLVCLPAQFPNPRLQHWPTLIRARAIENQYFVLACNRSGEDSPGRSYFGHSMIVDPEGEILLQGHEDEMLLATELNLVRVEQVQNDFPLSLASQMPK
jgi:omega-amidase